MSDDNSAKIISFQSYKRNPIQQADEPHGPINPRELASLGALIAYVAKHQGLPEKLVRAIVETEFGVDNIKELPRRLYEKAIVFLVSYRVDSMAN